MTDYKLGPKSIVDELAQFIRQVDGDNKMGAGALADKICERFRVDAPAVQGEPDVEALVEALEQVIKAAPSRGPLWHGSEQIVEARAALAAHRQREAQP